MKKNFLYTLLFTLLAITASFGQVQHVNTGTRSDDHTGDAPRVAFTKINSSLDYLDAKTGLNLTPTAVKTGSYTAASGDLVPVDASSGSVTITLPAAPADKATVAVKMINVSGSFTTTIARGGSAVFNKSGGSTSLTLSLLNQGVVLQYKATGAIWYVVADDLSLAQLDARYMSTMLTRNRQTGDYTLALTDNFKLVEINSASTQTVTVPPNSSVAFTADQTQITVSRYGAGAVNIAAGVGVTIRSAGGALGLRAQYSSAVLIKIGTDEWYLYGDIQ